MREVPLNICSFTLHELSLRTWYDGGESHEVLLQCLHLMYDVRPLLRDETQPLGARRQLPAKYKGQLTSTLQGRTHIDKSVHTHICMYVLLPATPLNQDILPGPKDRAQISTTPPSPLK